MHLRVTRDGRGFEHTFLVHAVQHGGKTQTRILYWFRSPVEVRVGRTALDEEALRAIETSHPGRAFSWERIRESRPAAAEPQPAPEPQQGDRRGNTGRNDRHDGRRGGRSEASALPEPPQPPAAGAPAPSGPARRRGRAGRARHAQPGSTPAPRPAGGSAPTGQGRDARHGGDALG
jgi:hypothetical protein